MGHNWEKCESSSAITNDQREQQIQRAIPQTLRHKLCYMYLQYYVRQMLTEKVQIFSNSYYDGFSTRKVVLMA